MLCLLDMTSCNSVEQRIEKTTKINCLAFFFKVILAGGEAVAIKRAHE